jgi:hypothetical protein
MIFDAISKYLWEEQAADNDEKKSVKISEEHKRISDK